MAIFEILKCLKCGFEWNQTHTTKEEKKHSELYRACPKCLYTECLMGRNIREKRAGTELLNNLGFEITLKGYPDFILLKEGQIVGFAEVKPKGENLRKEQEVFKQFCDKNKIPFLIVYQE